MKIRQTVNNIPGSERNDFGNWYLKVTKKVKNFYSKKFDENVRAEISLLSNACTFINKVLMLQETIIKLL